MNPFRIITYLALAGVIVYAANTYNTKLAAAALIAIILIWTIAWVCKHYGKEK